MKDKESKRLDGETVFSATHAEISQTAVYQCKHHHWVKIDDENLACTKCPTVIKVAKETINEYL